MVSCTRKVKMYYGSASFVVYSTAIGYYVSSGIWLTAAGWASTALLALFYTLVVYCHRIELVPYAPYITLGNVFGTTAVSCALYVLAAQDGDGLEVTSVFLAAIAFTMALKWSVTLHLEVKKQQQQSEE